MAGESLSTLQLEQMRGYAEAMQTARHAIESVSSELVVASDYMLKLLAEVERLRTIIESAHRLIDELDERARLPRGHPLTQRMEDWLRSAVE